MKRSIYLLLSKSVLFISICLLSIGVAFGQTAGEDCSTAILIPVASSLATCNYSTVTSGSTQNGPNALCSDITGNVPNDDRWLKFVAPSTGNKLVITTTAGTVNDWTMEVWSGCVGTGSVIKCSDDVNAAMPEISLCQNEYIAGQTYYVRAWTYSQTAIGNMNICIYQTTACIIPPSNDECINSIRLNVNPPLACPGSSQTYSTLYATASGFTASCDAGTKNDVWFVFNTGSLADINMTISPLTAVGLKAELVFDCAGLEQACYSPANGSYLFSGLNPSADYTIRVWSTSTTPGTFKICLSDVCSNPTATISGTQAICPSQSATLSVAFTGVAPYTFVYSNGTTNTSITTSSNPYPFTVTPTVATTYSIVSMTDATCSGSGSGSATVSFTNPQPVSLNPFNPICASANPVTLTGGSPGGGVYSGVGVTNGVFNPSSGTQTITYTVTYATGCTRNNSQVFTVNAPPTAVISGSTTICTGQSAVVPINFTGTAPFVLTYTNGTASTQITTSTNPYLLTISPTSTTTYSLLSLIDASCAGTLSGSATITVINPANPTLSAFASACSNGSNITLSGGSPAGGVYSGVGVSGGVFSPSSGTQTITYTVTYVSGCTRSTSQVLTVNAPPTAVLEGIQTICSSQTATLNVTFTGAAPYTFVYFNGAINTTLTTSSNPFSFNVTPSSTTTYTLVSLTNGTCSGTVSGSPVVTVINPANPTQTSFTPVCVNAGLQTLSGGSPTGGVYSGTGVSAGKFDPLVGTQTITYTVTYASGCTRNTSQVFTVVQLPTVVLNSLGSICNNAATFSLTTGTPTGGTYSGTGVSANTFNPATAGVGTFIITYTYTNGNGCTSSDTALITVSNCTTCGSPATANAGPDKTTCNGAAISIVGTIGGSATSGTWSGGAGTYNPSNTSLSMTYTPTAAEKTAGSVTLNLTTNDPDGTGPCTAVSNAMVLTIPVAPTATLTGTQTICTTASVNLSVAFTGPAPYTFVYSNGTTNSSVTTTTNPYTIAVTPTVSTTYTLISLTNGTCTGTVSSSAVVTVLNPSNPTQTAFTPVCVNAGLQTLSGGSPAGGVYSGTGVSAGKFDPSVGTQTITYTITFQAGCTRSISQVFTVNPLPTVVLNSLGSICNSTPAFSLTTGTPTGGTYSGTGVSANAFNPATAGVGTFIITYNYTNGNGCTSSDTALITVTNCNTCGSPATANAGPDKTTCNGAAISIVGTIGGSATSGTWTGGAGTYSPNNTSLSITYTPTASEKTAGSVTLNLTTNDPDGTGPCTAVSDAMVLSIPVAPTAATISGSAVICTVTTGNIYSVPSLAGVTYLWSIPANYSIASGQGTNSISVTTTTTSASGNICVTRSNSCGTNQSCFAVLIRSVKPVTPGTISGINSTCINQSNVYKINKVANADYYLWTPPVGATINGSSAAFNTTDTSVTVLFGATFTTDTIAVQAGNCKGISIKKKLTIARRTTAPSTPASITGLSVVCNTPTSVYQVKSTSGAQTYTWRSTLIGILFNGLASPYTTTDTVVTVTYPTFTTTTLYVKASNACGSSTERSLAIRKTPAAPTSVTGPLTVCTGQTGVAYSIAAITGATSYTWTVPTALTILTGQNTTAITVSFSTTAANRTITVKGNNACGAGATKSIVVVAASCPRIGDASETTYNVEAYPNPSKGLLHIEFISSNESRFNLTVTDLSGRVLQKTNIEAVAGLNQFDWNLSDLSSGIYLMSVNGPDGNKMIRIEME